MADEINSSNPAGDWLDSFASDPDSSSVAALEPAARRALADQLFVDVLLDHVLGGETLESQALVDKVLTQVEEVPAAPAPEVVAAGGSSRRRWIASGLTIAAGIIGVAIVWTVNEATLPSAEAAVEKAARQATRPVDRHYRVAVHLRAVQPIHADLYLRGANHVALNAHLPLDPWLGSNGQVAWLAPKLGPVFVVDDVFRVQERISNVVGVPLPFLRITNVLGDLARNYDLRLKGVGKLEGFAHARWLRVEATLRPGLRLFAPRNVELWADLKSGDVGRLVLDWSGRIENLAVQRIEFHLVDKDERPAAWYEHTAHHRPGRDVIELARSQYDRGR